jgi:hypothetical protein
MTRLLRVLAMVLVSVGVADSQTAVVSRTANLRPETSTSGTPLRKIQRETQVQLNDASPTNGIQHVRVNDRSGWVWSKFVQIQQTPSHNTGGNPPTTPSKGDVPATAISADWEKPVVRGDYARQRRVLYE